MDLRHDRRVDSNEAYAASLGPADAATRLSSSYDGSFYPAAASIIKLSFYGSSEALACTYAKECSISVHDGC